MDYGKKAPDLGWRFTDAWLSMAGAGDVGLPNGVPVDEWGIRVDGCNPVGSSVSPRRRRQRPGRKVCFEQVHGMAAGSTPLQAPSGMDFYQSLPSLAKGNVAQQIFWYTAFTASMVAPQSEGNNTVDADGNPALAHGPKPARTLLGRRHEARLPGRRLLDPHAVHA